MLGHCEAVTLGLQATCLLDRAASTWAPGKETDLLPVQGFRLGAGRRGLEIQRGPGLKGRASST